MTPEPTLTYCPSNSDGHRLQPDPDDPATPPRPYCPDCSYRVPPSQVFTLGRTDTLAKPAGLIAGDRPLAPTPEPPTWSALRRAYLADEIAAPEYVAGIDRGIDDLQDREPDTHKRPAGGDRLLDLLRPGSSRRRDPGAALAKRPRTDLNRLAP